MNERDFKNALHQTMTAQPAPPPMSDTGVLEAARRDRKRRRAMWAGGGTAAAVVAIAVGVAVLAPPGGGGGTTQVGGQPEGVTATADVPTQSNAPQPTGSAPNNEDTKTSWPDGQTDRTATKGPQFDRGVALAAELAGIIPAGYESPDLESSGERTGSLKYNQANYDDTVDGVQQWSYSAEAPVTKGSGVGRFQVEVRTSKYGNLTGEGCALLNTQGSGGSCTEVVVGGKKVGVATYPMDGQINQFDQVAAFRHEDGTMVFLSQASEYAFTGLPRLDGLPLTTEQLAGLAVDPRFNID